MNECIILQTLVETHIHRQIHTFTHTRPLSISLSVIFWTAVFIFIAVSWNTTFRLLYPLAFLWKILWPKCCVLTSNNKDKDNSSKNYTQNIVHQASSKEFRLIIIMIIIISWQMDQRKRKLMTMHKALNPIDNSDRLYVSRKEEGRELAGTEASVDASVQRLEDYIGKPGGILITATRNNADDTSISRMEITRKQK